MGKPKQVDEVKTEATIGEVKDETETVLEGETEEAQDATEQAVDEDQEGVTDTGDNVIEAGDSATDDTGDTAEPPSDKGQKEEQIQVEAAPKEFVMVRYEPKHDLPGMLNGYQVQPGETHRVSEGEWMKVKGNKAYKRVK